MIGSLIARFDTLIWGAPLIIICLGCGLFFSLATKFSQIRLIKDMVSNSFQGNAEGKKLSSFETLSIAVGGRVGTGNIVGTASAILYGGPGSIFWMWVICLVGTVSAFAESVLAQVWKEKDDSEFYGGHPFYMMNGLKCKPLAFFWASTCMFFTIIFSGVQSSSFVSVASYITDLHPIVWGLIFTVPLAILAVGGAKRIAKAFTIIVPFMSIGYIAVALIVILINITELPAVLGLIVHAAFDPKAVLGGTFGSTISWGIKRGIFSNEAGLGTAPLAAGRTETSHPAKIGLSQSFSVYITLAICTVTALAILITGQYNVVGESGQYLVENVPGVDYSQFATVAFNSVVPHWGGIFITIALFLFNFTTVSAYPVYLGSVKHFLFGRGGNEQRAAFAMKVINVAIIIMAFLGSIVSIDLLWNLASALSGLMSFINVICLLIMYKPVIAVLKDYEQQKKKHLDPVFVPENCGINNAQVWHSIVEDSYKNELEAYKKEFKN